MSLSLVKALLIAALILAGALLATTAAFAGAGEAAPHAKLPAAMLGGWCPDKRYGYYRRGRDCRDSDGWLEIRANGYETHETSCRIIAGSLMLVHGRYIGRYRCGGEGTVWFETGIIHLEKGSLFFKGAAQP